MRAALVGIAALCWLAFLLAAAGRVNREPERGELFSVTVLMFASGVTCGAAMVRAYLWGEDD